MSTPSPPPEKSATSLTARALRLALFRIGLVSVCAGLVSYYVNQMSIEDDVRKRLVLSVEQTLQRESLPFQEIMDAQRNFLAEFKDIYAQPDEKQALVRDFDHIFYRHEDGSYTQRPGLFEGQALPDGRRFKEMSATYAPDMAPTDDTKARFALSYILSHKYGSSAKGRLFNFYGVVPEKGFPIFQAQDIAKVFTYSGPDALKLETFEFYQRGFASASHDPFFTLMYWDPSNKAWMTTIATPDVADASGQHKIMACVDVLLDELMTRTAKPYLPGAHSTLFLADADGTLIYHPQFLESIKSTEGKASIKSLNITNDYPLLQAARDLSPGKARLVETHDDIMAMGLIPGTPWVLAVHYPRALMIPSIIENLVILAALGLVTLLVEIFVLRSILQNQVALPLSRLIQATRTVRLFKERLNHDVLPIQSADEIGELAREFSQMADHIYEAHEQLESKVQERTAELEAANRQLQALSSTDGLTGIANRRRFDEVLETEWQRAQRAGGFLSLAIADVDWFKRYNDHYGHQAGDDCLRSVVNALQSNVLRAGDLVARYGGEEFAVISTSVDRAHALEFAQRLCSAVQARALPHTASPLGYVSISIGMAVTQPVHGSDAAGLLKKADEALYRAKAQGRNQAVLAEDEQNPEGNQS
ncbi:MAG: diguanylate cyclase [Comamonadaceae bacterium]|nr:MAG: diguanylate cyclase [Comamonadaceae bacterium]